MCVGVRACVSGNRVAMKTIEIIANKRVNFALSLRSVSVRVCVCVCVRVRVCVHDCSFIAFAVLLLLRLGRLPAPFKLFDKKKSQLTV